MKVNNWMDGEGLPWYGGSSNSSNSGNSIIIIIIIIIISSSSSNSSGSSSASVIERMVQCQSECSCCVNFVQYFQVCICYQGLNHVSAFHNAFVTFPVGKGYNR